MIYKPARRDAAARFDAHGPRPAKLACVTPVTATKARDDATYRRCRGWLIQCDSEVAADSIAMAAIASTSSLAVCTSVAAVAATPCARTNSVRGNALAPAPMRAIKLAFNAKGLVPSRSRQSKPASNIVTAALAQAAPAAGAASSYPDGVGRYETAVLFRPDMSEEERTEAIDRYESWLIKEGGMEVEAFTRGSHSLQYEIRKANPAGETVRYTDSIFVIYSFVIQKSAIERMAAALRLDYDVLRYQSFKQKLVL
eukprot:jgi/Mesvir1/5937/Mv00702-RA.1